MILFLTFLFQNSIITYKDLHFNKKDDYFMQNFSKSLLEKLENKQ